MKLKGKTYGVPQDTEARPMYYRKDLLAKMGWSKDMIERLPDAVKNGEFAWPDLVLWAKEAISNTVATLECAAQVKAAARMTSITGCVAIAPINSRRLGTSS